MDVLTENKGPVRILTLNRPERRNAIDMPMRIALAVAIETAMEDAAVRAVVMTGAGAAFCAGGDISTMRQQSPSQIQRRAEAAQRVVRAIWTGSKPVIAAVEGAAFGAGMSLALACDRVVASADATFSTAFTRVGLAGDMGIFASLPVRVGPARARQLLMLPHVITGTEAAAMGMADAAVDSGTALTAAVADADRIAQGPPLAIAAIKRLLSDWPADPAEVLHAELTAQVRLWASGDFAEGVAAFQERRPPVFKGI